MRLQDRQDPGPSQTARRRFAAATAEGHRLAGSLGARLPERGSQKENGPARHLRQTCRRYPLLSRLLQVSPPRRQAYLGLAALLVCCTLIEKENAYVANIFARRRGVESLSTISD